MQAYAYIYKYIKLLRIVNNPFCRGLALIRDQFFDGVALPHHQKTGLLFYCEVLKYFLG